MRTGSVIDMDIQMKRTTVAASVLSLALLLTGSTYAQSIYKCRNAAGKIDLSDRPCSADSKTEAIRDGSAISESRRQEAAQVAGANRAAVASQESARRPVQPASSGNAACDKLASGERSGRMGEVTALIAACNPEAARKMAQPQQRTCAHAQDTDCVMTTHY